jgi:hypothetical protein
VPGLIDGELAPVFEPLDFARIHPSAIRQMMDEADIKYRVIVLSACDADGFAHHLRGPNSLVIVASGRGSRDAACTGDGSYTPFGQRFFGEALGRTSNISDAVEALADTSADIGEIDIRMGEAISAKLAAIGEQLASDLAEANTVPKITAPKLRSPDIRQR